MARKAKFRIGISALLPLLALCAMAISHPVYDLMVRGDHAAFFVAHEARAIDIYLIVFALSGALPLALFISVWACSHLSRNLARVLYALILFILFFALFTPASQKLFGELGWGNVVLGVSAAFISTLLFFLASWVRDLLSFAALTAVVSPIMFLTNPAVVSFLSTPEAQDYDIDLPGKNYPNVIMVIFDELPLISLLDENRQIDAVRFPNFKRLAETSTWYRNTVTAHTTTLQAVPSMLTGRYVNDHQPVADLENYPESLISFLRPTHQIHGVEVVTKFFQTPIDDKIAPDLWLQFRAMSMDLLVVWGHLVLPESFAAWLPAIDSRWSDFRSLSTGSEFAEVGGPKHFREFISLLRQAPKSTPAFFYLHMLLPHSPLRFDEDGTSLVNELQGYGLGTRSATPSTHADNEQNALLIYQAHLLQTRFVDLLLGRLLDELEALKIFRDSIVIVTSDHGIGYLWYEDAPPDLFPRRAEEVYYVPLLIKYPDQNRGGIVDERVVTVDIFPTVAEILGRPIPWRVDGFSVSDHEQERADRLGTGNPDTRETWLPAGEPDWSALEEKISLFGQHNLRDLYFYGPHKELVGQDVDRLPVRADPRGIGAVTIDLQPVKGRLKSSIPYYLKGELTSLSSKSLPEDLNLAIAVNGTIRGTTKPTTNSDGRTSFIVRIPPESWGAKNNSVSVYEILEDENSERMSIVPFSVLSIE